MKVTFPYQPAVEQQAKQDLYAKTKPARWVGLWEFPPAPRAPIQIGDRVKWTKTYFFASYSRDDSKAVCDVVQYALGYGFAFWIDQLDLQPGVRWTRDVVRAIRRSRAIVVFLSANAYPSNDVFREIATAGRANKVMIPVFLDDTPVPDEFMYYLSIHQGVRVSWSDWRQRFISALRRCARPA
jgi:hypothetical protein